MMLIYFFSEYDMRNTKIYSFSKVKDFLFFTCEALKQEESEFCLNYEEELKRLQNDSEFGKYYRI